MTEYAEKRKEENENEDRKEYSLADNNCGTFMVETVDESDDVDNIETGWYRSPQAYFAKYVTETNHDIVGYDPKGGKAVIQRRATKIDEDDLKERKKLKGIKVP